MRLSRPLFIFTLALALLSAARTPAQPISFLTVPPGYEAGSIDLPRGFAGGIGVDPADDNILYASVGNFADINIARIDLAAGTANIVATGPFGSIGGIAPLSSTQIVLIESHGVPGSGITSNTLLLATDLNSNGDFDDPGEIVELIPPILVSSPFGFSGSQARLAPAGNPSGIPSGSVLFQTADGNGEAEILVVTDPLGTPDYRPAGGAYFTGFDFNGGFDFDSQGRIMMGTLTGFFAGEVIALVNLNSDEVIGTGEFHTLVSGENGMSDLVIDGGDNVFFTGYDASFTSAIRSFPIPPDPLSHVAAPFDFALTDSFFLGGLMINSKSRPFQPNSGPGGATLLVGGFASSNLLTLTPSGPARAGHWETYE